MYLLSLFNIGRTALLTSQTALSVTGNNIANVNTPGYSRQEVVLEVSTPNSVRGGFLGTGVSVSQIKRRYDGFIQSQLLGQYQNQGRSSALDQSFSQIEQIFNESQNMGLSGPLSDYFNAWQDLSANPEGQTQRTALLQKASSLVIAARRMEGSIQDNLKSINGEITTGADQINTIASQIADLNKNIVQLEGGGTAAEANDLRDQRQNLMNELGQLTEFSSYEEPSGYVNVSIGMRSLVYQDKANTLTAQTNENGDKDIYLDTMNISSRISTGKLGGLLSARDTIETEQLTGLRKMVASLTREINLVHEAGYGLDGSMNNDFFNPLQLATKDGSSGADITASITDMNQLTLDEYNITFDGSGNYHVLNKSTGAEAATGAYVSGNPISFDGIQINITGTITSSDTFSVSPLTNAIQNFGVAISDYKKIAAASSSASLPGDNSNALSIINLSGANIANLGDKTLMGYYQGIVGEIATLSRAASDSLTFDNNLLTELSNRRESLSGVSLDEEAVNLIKYQRAFQAGARMINVTDELLQTILNL
jgi:flagellar hook-associated protein 1